MKGILKTLLGAVLCVQAYAQSNVPATSLDDLVKANRAILEALKQIPTVVDNEIAAGRLKPQERPINLSFSEFCERLAGDGRFDSLAFHAGARSHRSTNANINAAWGAFEQALDARRNFMRDRLPRAIEARIREAAEAWRAARLPTDLAASIRSLGEAEELADRFSRPTSSQTAPNLEETIRYLEKFKDLLAADHANDPKLIRRAFQALDISYQKSPFGDFVTLKELETRRKAPLKRLREQSNAALRNTVEALANASKPEELDTVIEKIHAAAETEEDATGRMNGQWDSRLSEAERLAIDWQKMLVLEAQGAWTRANSQGQSMEDRAERIDGTLATVLARRRAGNIQRQTDEAKERIRKLTPQVAAIETAADAAQLVTEIRANRSQIPSPEENRHDLDGLLNDLERIAQEDLSQYPEGTFERRPTGRASAHPWSAEITIAWTRVRRRAVAELLGRPELLEPPFNVQSIEEALGSMIGDAVTRKDWLVAYQLMRERAVINPTTGEDPETQTLRAFLIGRNYEKAELLPDAIQQYKVVLQNVSPRSPATEASERLKALKKLYPSLFPSPK